MNGLKHKIKQIEKSDCLFTLLLDIQNNYSMDWHSQNVAEASILFHSYYYHQLKCRIVQKQNNLTLCCKLINNCTQTYFNINRGLEDFNIQLYNASQIIGIFNFTYEDLDRHIGLEDTHGKNKKYIKFKKQNDSCLLQFTVQYKDVMYLDKKERNYSYFYQDFIRGLASKVYKNLEAKAIKRIQKIENIKFQDKRMSMENNFVVRSKSKKQKRKDSAPLVSFLMKTPSNKESNILSQIKFSKTWQVSKEKLENKNKIKNRHEKKDDLHFRKIKQKIKEQFKRQEFNLLDLVVIPKLKTNKKGMELISQNIYFPKRPKSQAFDNPGVNFQAFMTPKTFMTKESLTRKNTMRLSAECFKQNKIKDNFLSAKGSRQNKIIKIKKVNFLEFEKKNQFG